MVTKSASYSHTLALASMEIFVGPIYLGAVVVSLIVAWVLIGSTVEAHPLMMASIHIMTHHTIIHSWLF